MAAHLDLIHLRWHALPAHFLLVAAPCAGTAVAPPASVANPRPRLTATWRLGADGRPLCGWSVDTDDPANPHA
jgi:hypothetical protein